MTEKEKNLTQEDFNNTHDEEGNSIWTPIVLSGATVFFFYGYYAGYVLAIGTLSLGSKSFLVAGVIFALMALYAIYEYITEAKKK